MQHPETTVSNSANSAADNIVPRNNISRRGNREIAPSSPQARTDTSVRGEQLSPRNVGFSKHVYFCGVIKKILLRAAVPAGV